MSTRIAVLGAGMVGACCAVSLQRRGFDVVLIDRKPPGRETSFGNSGVFSRSSIFPINGPGLMRQIPRYLTNRHPAVRWRRAILHRPGWIVRFVAECAPDRLEPRVRALDALIRASMPINRARLAEAGLGHHLRETGWLKLWRDPPDGVAEAEARALAAYAIDTRVLDPDGIASLEPAARAVFRSGLLIVGSASVDDPGAIVAGYADLFQREGGTFRQAAVDGLQPFPDGWRIETSAGAERADSVVVALGPWSGDLLARLGIAVPLGFERGYHVHLEMPPGAGPRRAVYDVDGGYVVSPMLNGARVTSGVELSPRDAPPAHRQIEAAATLARRTFGLGSPREATPWRGARPTLPDSLPMIGPVPRAKGLYAAFGHHHIGFSTGAATGELIAGMIAGEPSAIDARPFDPARYIR